MTSAGMAIIGRVFDTAGRPVKGAFVHLLDSSDESVIEDISSTTGAFRFFTAPGSWRIRARSMSGSGHATIAPSVGFGVQEINIKLCA